jgi:asparagine synthase (glutamine-hydrolysing)
MEEWFREGDFGTRCLAAFERSALRSEGFIDGDYFTTLLKDQIAGRQSVSFPIWTVMNAVLWHASWVEGREDCL